MMNLAEICAVCTHRQQRCLGRCICLADDKGEDIQVKQAARSCPLDMFVDGAMAVARPRIRGVKAREPHAAEVAARRPISEAGREIWGKWHSHLTGSPELLAEGLAILPSCGCLGSFMKILERLPPIYGPGWFRRVWEWHEAVNAELGKLGMSFVDAAVRYGRRDLIEQPTTAV